MLFDFNNYAGANYKYVYKVVIHYFLSMKGNLEDLAYLRNYNSDGTMANYLYLKCRTTSGRSFHGIEREIKIKTAAYLVHLILFIA